MRSANHAVPTRYIRTRALLCWWQWRGGHCFVWCARSPPPMCSHVLLSPQITMRNVNPEYAERCGLPGRDVTVAAVLQVTPFLEDGAKAVRGKETFRSAAVFD